MTKKILTTVAAFAIFGYARSQQALGFGVDQSSSGNGHGSYYFPHASFSGGRNTVDIGILVQKRSQQTNGFRVTYERNLSSPRSAVLNRRKYDMIQLNSFGYVQYNGPMPLSYCLVKEEGRRRREDAVEWNKIMLSTVEASAGIEIVFKFNAIISWKTYAGASVYYHTNYPVWMCHERFASSLCLGTGIQINFVDWIYLPD